jgi:mRNA-degrading endonuclease RelE of RelBE toxin-antitoxin system
VELEKIDINGINDIYTLSVVKKEFRKAVDEPWKDTPPWKRYQKKLIQDLAVLDEEKERAIDFAQFEKLSDEENLYSIRHPETKKNVRVIYTIVDNVVVLLVAFLEKKDSDYQNAINTAKYRIKWLESE